MIQVPPSRFPVEIADLQPMFPNWAGTNSPITLGPGKAVVVDLVMAGCANRAKGQTATVTVRVEWASQAIPIWGIACRVTGTSIGVGTFRKKPS